jgi:hypothetical protein
LRIRVGKRKYFDILTKGDKGREVDKNSARIYI